MEVVHEGGRLVGGFDPVPPTHWVQGASGASTMRFGENFIQQKLKGTPDLVGAGHLFGLQIRIWKDLWASCPSGAMVTHYEGELIKSNVGPLSTEFRVDRMAFGQS